MRAMSKEFYDTLHSSYFPLESELKSHAAKARLNRCIELIREQKPSNVLEVGFESPVLSSLIAGLPGVRYFGVDISEISVKAAQEVGLSVSMVDVSRDKLPFNDNTFDLVYCSEVIEHLVNPDFAMEEFRRVLKSGGNLLVTTPNLAAWYNRVFLLLGIQPIHSEVSTKRVLGRKLAMLGQGNRPVGHLRLFTLAGLLDFLGYHRFETLKVEGYPLELLGRLMMMDKLFSKVPSIASGFIVLVRRGEEENVREGGGILRTESLSVGTVC